MSTKKYRETHEEEIKKSSKEYYKKNRKRILAKVKKWKKDNPEKYKKQRAPKKIKNYQLNKKYGITLDQFNQMLTSQDGKCAICESKFKNPKDTCVDHNHITGKIRQLLCFNCNIGIGKFNDSIELVKEALSYLRKWA